MPFDRLRLSPRSLLGTLSKSRAASFSPLFVAACALVIGGCGVELECPVDWAVQPPPRPEGTGPCEVPEGYAEEVGDRLGPSFFGFASISFNQSDEDMCDPEYGGLAREFSFEVTVVERAGTEEVPEVVDTLTVTTDDDGMWELAVDPQFDYLFSSESQYGLRYTPTDGATFVFIADGGC